jgi:DNA primase
VLLGAVVVPGFLHLVSRVAARDARIKPPRPTILRAEGYWKVRMDNRRFTEKIRSANPIHEILEERGVEIQNASDGWKCLCPFLDHFETKPSFSISSDGHLYFCFGCERGGDVFTLINILDGLDFLAARKKLAKRAGIRLPKTTTKGSGRER